MSDNFDEEDYDDREPDPCERLEYDADILTGRAHCWSCGRAWWMSDAEFKAEAKFQADACEAMIQEMAAENEKTVPPPGEGDGASVN